MIPAVALLSLLATAATDAEAPTARFALVIGVNRALDASTAPLTFADDDAARSFDLFRAMGARALLLSSLDPNTTRLHPQAVAEARPATRAGLEAAVTRIAADVATARERAIATELYVVYAGHGDADKGQGYVTLEDGRLTGAEILRDVIERIGARRAHVIVDACSSFLLVSARGPGGARRTLAGFSQIGTLLGAEGVGLFLSTSSASESHEWEAIQSGIFSHEVRSGLAGAADADGDGRVRYDELAAFIERANGTIPNEKFRPRVFARPPSDSPVLADLRGALQERRIEIPGDRSGRWFLEDAQGVRLVDLHSAAGTRVALLHRPAATPLFLRDVDLGVEVEIAGDGVVDVGALTPVEPRTKTRSAAHHAFTQLFAEPFDAASVARVRLGVLPEEPAPPPPPGMLWGAGIAGTGLGVGAAVAAVGVVPALTLYDAASTGAQKLAARDALVGFVGAGATLAVVGAVAGVGAAVFALVGEEP